LKINREKNDDTHVNQEDWKQKMKTNLCCTKILEFLSIHQTQLYTDFDLEITCSTDYTAQMTVSVTHQSQLN